MNKLTRALLYLLIFSIPFENSILLPVVGNLSNLLTMALTVSALLTVLSNRKVKKTPLVYTLIFIFSLWLIASLYWGNISYINLFHLALYLQGFFIFWAIFEFIDTKERIHKLLKAFVLGCGVILILALQSYYTSTSGGVAEPRFIMEGYNANAMGIMWVLGISIALYLMFNESKKYAIYVPFATFAILLTASRTALILLLIVGLASIWYMFSRKIKYRKTILSVAVLLAVITLNFVPQTQLDRLGSIDDELSGGDLSGRTAIWQSGISTFKENPIIGVGVGSFKEASAAYSMYGAELSSHNSYLTILVETGLLGFGVFVLFLLGVLVLASKTKRNVDLGWLSSLLILLWLVLSFASHAELQKYTWMIFGIIVSIYYSAQKEPNGINVIEEKTTVKKDKRRRKRFKRYRITW